MQSKSTLHSTLFIKMPKQNYHSTIRTKSAKSNQCELKDPAKAKSTATLGF